MVLHSLAVFTSVAESGVLLTLRHLCEPRKRRESTQEYWEAILDAFAGCDDIYFAYPTQRAYTDINLPHGHHQANEIKTDSVCSM
jgi:hypothetical protein